MLAAAATAAAATAAATAAAATETFDPGHLQLDDATLQRCPATPLSDLKLFVCTYVGRLSNLHMDVDELTARLCHAPHGALLAVNSNYGHACQPGHEALLKAPARPAAARPVLRGRPRKGQGDGTCFNSAVEPIIGLAGAAGAALSKVYKTKVFPSTGEFQAPGVLNPDLSDGHAALVTLAEYLNMLGIGDSADGTPGPHWAQLRKAAEESACAGNPDALPAYRRALTAYAAVPPEGARLAIGIESEGPKMLNYKFRIMRSCPRILINLVMFSTYLSALEGLPVGATPINVAAAVAASAAARGINMAAVATVMPPFPIRETNPPIDDVKVSFRFRSGRRMPRVNVFQGGKVNILGADSIECARRIYNFFMELFTVNWSQFICLQPLRDRPQAAPRIRGLRRALAAAVPAPVPLPVLVPLPPPVPLPVLVPLPLPVQAPPAVPLPLPVQAPVLLPVDNQISDEDLAALLD
jgi:hypothetical protein